MFIAIVSKFNLSTLNKFLNLKYLVKISALHKGNLCKDQIIYIQVGSTSGIQRRAFIHYYRRYAVGKIKTFL